MILLLVSLLNISTTLVAQDLNSLRLSDPEFVGDQFMELDFEIAGLHVDRDEKFAVAWGVKFPEKSVSRYQRRITEPGPDEVAVLNLETMEVVVQRSIAAGVQSAVIKANYWPTARAKFSGYGSKQEAGQV